jgi:hypothetical protein
LICMVRRGQAIDGECGMRRSEGSCTRRCCSCLGPLARGDKTMPTNDATTQHRRGLLHCRGIGGGQEGEEQGWWGGAGGVPTKEWRLSTHHATARYTHNDAHRRHHARIYTTTSSMRIRTPEGVSDRPGSGVGWWRWWLTSGVRIPQECRQEGGFKQWDTLMTHRLTRLRSAHVKYLPFWCEYWLARALLCLGHSKNMDVNFKTAQIRAGFWAVFWSPSKQIWAVF